MPLGRAMVGSVWVCVSIVTDGDGRRVKAERAPRLRGVRNTSVDDEGLRGARSRDLGYEVTPEWSSGRGMRNVAGGHNYHISRGARRAEVLISSFS